MEGDLWRIVGCGEEGIVLEHATGDVVGKLLYWFPNVSEESVKGPAANEHDGTLSRYIAMAAPERMEWVPMSSGWKPRRYLQTLLEAEQSFLRTVEELIVFSFPSSNIVLTVVSALVPG